MPTPPLPEEAATRRCTRCGAPLREEDGTRQGCLSCLLLVGLGEVSEADHRGAADLGATETYALPPPESRRFQHYEVCLRGDGVSLYELGRGAMGVTYKALDTNLDSVVALKVIGARYAAHTRVRERFRREARSAARLHHPNVAGVFHFGETATGQCFYAMEFIEGETLEERVRREGPLSPEQTLEVGLQVARALVAAEAHGLVHRDLKPSNLMVVTGAPGSSDVPVVKIIDFGLAKAAAAARSASCNDLTHGDFVGTPAYASPEQFRGGEMPLDTRSDIYSLGVSLWYLLCGKSPFAGHTREEIRDQQTNRPLPLERLGAMRVPAPLVALLRSMLASDPAERPQSARALAESLRRCREQIITGAAASASRRRALLVASALALLLLGIIVAAGVADHLPWRRRDATHETAAAALTDKSVAVLPFENRSEDQENAFFADGVQDEVLTHLAKIADLKVISRASVQEYKNKPRDLREIGRQLGVEHVVEGSVRRAGNRVRVIAQLTSTHTGIQLWAERYDRELANVFAIQSEIAKAIAEQLQAKISPREKAAMAQTPTTDLAANALYVQAKKLETSFAADPERTQSLLQAVRLLEEATARDPKFVLAYCLLGRVNLNLYFGGADHTPARLERANVAIQQAARLQPDAGEVHLEMANYHYNGFRDYDRARAELDLARRTLSNEVAVYALHAALDRRQARWAEAMRNYERAVELNPRNVNTLENAAFTYMGLRRYAEASRLGERAMAASPRAYFGARTLRAFQPVWERADVQPLRKELTMILQEDPGAAERVVEALFRCALFERDPAATQRALSAIPPEGLTTNTNFTYPSEWFAGLAGRFFGDPETARASFSAVRVIMANLVQNQSDYAPAWSLLGLVDAALGRKEEAVREGRRACELLPISKDAWSGPNYVVQLALIYAWTGERDLALEQLAAAAQLPNGVRYGGLKLDPSWDPLRGDPRFEAIVASLAPAPPSPVPTPASAAGASPPAATTPENSVAVLPFQPLVPENRDQVLELGMADTLIGKLSGSQIVVPSLTSVRRYDRPDQNPQAAGRELKVRSVLEGSVQRSGDRIRVNVRLIDVADGATRWAGTFDERFTNVFAVQDAISQKVVDALALRLSGEQRRQLTRRHTDNVQAYQLYLLGRYHWNKLTPPEIASSVGYYQQAIALDPNYALAHFGLADAYRSMAITCDVRPKDSIPRANAAAQKALELDESLAEAHASLVFGNIWFYWDWAGAEKEAKRAIALNPNSSFAHLGYAHMLSDLGRHPEAVAEVVRARELDPTSLIINSLEGAFLYHARRYDEASARLQKTLSELDPDFWIAHLFLGKTYLQQGNYPAAVAEFSRARESSRGNLQTISMLGYAYTLAGDTAKARAMLDELQTTSTQRYVPPVNVALVYYGLGQRDEAFVWLDRAHGEHDVHLSFLRADPQWDGLRADPRFVALLQRIGLL